MRVTVDKAALDALIEYANGARSQRDGEFCVSWSGHDSSDREFKAVVDALKVKELKLEEQ
jgi:hypothetical protein